jgi:hypothetical protein
MKFFGQLISMVMIASLGFSSNGYALTYDGYSPSYGPESKALFWLINVNLLLFGVFLLSLLLYGVTSTWKHNRSQHFDTFEKESRK